MFHFLFEKKIWLKKNLTVNSYKTILTVNSYKTIGFIIIWLNITLIRQRRLRWVLSETKISIWQFYFY